MPSYDYLRFMGEKCRSKMIVRLMLFVLATYFFSACSLEKRRYTSGYHVEWRGKTNKTECYTEPEKELANLPSQQEVPIGNKSVEAPAVVPLPPTKSAVADPLLLASDNEWPVLIEKDSIVPDEYFDSTKQAGLERNKNAADSKKLGTWAIIIFISTFVVPMLTSLLPILGVFFSTYSLSAFVLAIFFASAAVKKAKTARNEFAAFPGRFGNEKELRQGLRRGRTVLGIYIFFAIVTAIVIGLAILYLGSLL